MWMEMHYRRNIVDIFLVSSATVLLCEFLAEIIFHNIGSDYFQEAKKSVVMHEVKAAQRLEIIVAKL